MSAKGEAEWEGWVDVGLIKGETMGGVVAWEELMREGPEEANRALDN